jgi:glycosyltransferase involved in cell wall biosynthesis
MNVIALAKVTIDLTIITPCFNEEDSVQICADRVRDVMARELPKVSYEHIFSDNASVDGTLEILKDIARRDKKVKVVVNSRNVGPFRNIYRAMSKSSGRAIVPMLPADLQDPVEVIPEFYREWEAGTLVVFGVRTNRQESFLMRTLRAIYYRMIRRFADGQIPINSGEFMLIDRKIAENLLVLKDHYPYIRGLVAQSTDNWKSVKYTWVKREKGKSKSNPLALIDQAINGLISTSRVPARLALLGGFAFSGFGILAGIWSLIANLILGSGVSHGIPTLIVALFIFGGIQLFFLGLIGEYVLSIHAQVRQQPPAFDVELINFTD